MSSGKGHSPYGFTPATSAALSSNITYLLNTYEPNVLYSLLASIRTGFAIGVGGCGSLRLRLLPTCSLQRRRAEAGSVEAYTPTLRGVIISKPKDWCGVIFYLQYYIFYDLRAPPNPP